MKRECEHGCGAFLNETGDEGTRLSGAIIYDKPHTAERCREIVVRQRDAARLHVVDVARREGAALAALVPSYDRGRAEEREAIVSDLRIMSRDMLFPEGTRNAMSALAARFRDGLHLRPATTAEKLVDVQPATQNTGKSSR